MTLQALGLCDPQDLPARLGSIHKPNMKRHTIYRRAMQRQGTFEGWNVRTFESYEPSNLHSC